MVGSGLGAENGILIRSGAAIQTLRDARAVVLDKTGTLTTGRPEVTDVVALGTDQRALLTAVASAEVGSEHPVGQAIVRAARERGLPVGEPETFSAVRGKGIRATLDGDNWLVGSPRLMAEEGIALDDVSADIVRLEDEARTAVVAARNGVLVGIVAVADALKPEAAEAVRALQRMGLQTVMPTGDNRQTARAIARQAGIDQVVAEVLPDGQVDQIRRLQERYGVVAQVGDTVIDGSIRRRLDQLRNAL